MCGTVRSGQRANVPSSWVANRQATKCGGDSYLTLSISIMFTELFWSTFVRVHWNPSFSGSIWQSKYCGTSLNISHQDKSAYFPNFPKSISQLKALGGIFPSSFQEKRFDTHNTGGAIAGRVCFKNFQLWKEAAFAFWQCTSGTLAVPECHSATNLTAPLCQCASVPPSMHMAQLLTPVTALQCNVRFNRNSNS